MNNRTLLHLIKIIHLVFVMDIHQTTRKKAAGAGWNSFAKTLWITLQLHALVLRAEPGPGPGNKSQNPLAWPFVTFFVENLF